MLSETRLPLNSSEQARGLKAGARAVVCVCSCSDAIVVTVSLAGFLNGNTKSCGCLSREVKGDRLRELNRSPEHRELVLSCNTTHGMKHHPLYKTWQGMLARCENPDHRFYHRYGGRGITVCEEWHDVTRFIEDIEATIGPRPPDRYPSGKVVYSLDREDNDGNYEPGKVRWATQSEQIRNQTGRPQT